MLEVMLYVSLSLMTLLGYVITFTTLSINSIGILLFVLLTLVPIYGIGLFIKTKLLLASLKEYKKL